jgi:hypothetical protein
MRTAAISTSPASSCSPKMFTLERTLIPVVISRSGPPAKTHFWLKTIGLVCAVACTLALIIAILGTVACTAAAEPQSGAPQPALAIVPQNYEGMITDTRCGAKHSAAIGQTATKCTVACVHGGEQFVLIDGDRVYLLEGDLVALKQVAGQRVRIVGTLNGRKIAVRSVTAA